MNIILGRGLILFALFIASTGILISFVGGLRRNKTAFRWSQGLTYLFSACLILANLVMVWALLGNDFSVSYVAKVGSRSVPAWISVVSLWSSLEGSILFWGAIIGLFASCFVYLNRNENTVSMFYSVAVILIVGWFFTLLLSGPADPFSPVYPVPSDGPGPNPLLQNHLLMVFHPPTLYLGYVGLTIPFSMAIAAVLRGNLTLSWLRLMRKWTLIPWLFLTIGIVLGAWWAYEVLGWGGYWAWDPVENASLIPWLAATGYLHSTVVVERRRAITIFTLSLIIIAFLLTLFGTFLTRSGIFNSVHAFSQSSIGPAFLVFIALVSIFSLGILSGRAHLIKKSGHIKSPYSREAAFLFNNLLMTTFTFLVLFGTVYPVIIKIIKKADVSVGEPYFNQMAVPWGILLIVLMGIGPLLPWGKVNFKAFRKTLLLPIIFLFLIVLICLALNIHKVLLIITASLCGFAAVVSIREMILPIIDMRNKKNISLISSIQKSLAVNPRKYGGHLTHLAVLLMVIAIAGSNSYKQTVEVSLTHEQSFNIGEYSLKYKGLKQTKAANLVSISSIMEVSKQGKYIEEMAPALNYYFTQREPVGTPAVKTILHQDLYLSLMSFDKNGERVVIKAFINPLVAWIWWSTPLMVLGVLISLWPWIKKEKQVESE